MSAILIIENILNIHFIQFLINNQAKQFGEQIYPYIIIVTAFNFKIKDAILHRIHGNYVPIILLTVTLSV